ncbi:MAG TPA: substrate-binding domain-containing protein, partial [Spirochaetota bacterium]|nr:substrate-binding domain-containing protein [Spirochaetota bacterium]
SEEVRIKLATTTSTENSGLLKYLLPYFENTTNIKVDVIAVGTGKALKLGENGDVDVVLVHARNLEDKFVTDGFGVDRKDVMYNDFIILGPKNDPANIKKSKNVSDAFKAIFSKNTTFISRGDKSGTDVKEKEIWGKLGLKPSGKWYKEIGQGMEECINMAKNEMAYTLSDRGTYLSMKSKVDLVILFEKDALLSNPYGVIAVNPEKWKTAKYKEAKIFIDWLCSKEGQELIANYKIDGEVLFFPSAK